MKILLATLAAVFLNTFLATPTLGAGWQWDGGNALGFAAFAGLLYLTLTSAHRVDVRAHQVLAYGVFGIAVAHAFWFLLTDAAAIEFLKPGAPDYMWLGLVSLAALGMLMMVAIVPDRLRVHRNYTTFKYWHQIIAVTTIAAAAYHIVVSHFYLHEWYQSVLLVAFAVAAGCGRRFWVRLGRVNIATNAQYALMSLMFGALFVVVRNFPS